jgi:hypothetical protein
MVAIGVTGHRFLTHTDRISAGVDQALARIEQTFHGQPLTLISSLAEGADRLVVGRVLARRTVRLVVPLPLPVWDYLNDFESPESQKEFRSLLEHADEIITLPSAATREAAYEAAGLYVLDRCDVLLAIWDGQPEQGTGGTGAIVHRARQLHLPIAWIHASNYKPGTREPTSLGAALDTVTFDNI